MTEFFNYIDNIKITFTGGYAVATFIIWIIFFMTIFEKLFDWIKFKS